MFVGPVFTREAITAPRRPQFFVARVLLVATLLGLALTAWQVFVGAGGGVAQLAGPGDLARFGRAVFELLTPLVLTVAVLFSALFSAAAVSQEKSRGTLVLLLLTDLSNSELVLGRLLASLLTVLVATLAVVPFLLTLALLGGIDHQQVAWAIAVTAAAALAAGSLGSTLALWREKTFQALALTAIGLVLWLALGEVVASGVLGEQLLGLTAGDVAARISPWQALTAAMEPRYGRPPALFGIEQPAATGADSAAWFVGVGFALAGLLNLAAVALVRVWNPSRELRSNATATEAALAPREEVVAAVISPPDPADVVVGKARGQSAAVHHAGGKSRAVWDNPVLWREVRTWAYGKKVLVVKAAYVAIFVVCAVATVQALGRPANGRSAIPPAAIPMAPLLVVSLVLVNALSVTSLTGERDGKSLDLLLTTDLSPKELILGKLGGAFWNAREMILLPVGLCCYLGWVGALTGWELAVLLACLIVMTVFSAVLGLHAAMIYNSSRKAIGVSVGTLLFLFLGVSTCMRMMLALSNTFDGQLASFLGFIVGGGLALFVALAWRNPSTAMALASFSAPFATFYAIVSFLLGSYSLVGLATVGTFGFATASMLVPALSEFDIATGSQPSRED
ncbi:ABC-2 family transporter protein [Botrimarina colliarenosi]|uniref:ABC-2 family transporter protein n=1 Tax=Botrimarina colliarenosi TaxID=2528001 RepID=A0A5C6AI79_9BACT|nr:ABC transporter permease [Botrimarina colliarenosi]TWT99752.1 ABC-2 family transporter protein [Botrimarina colliarenosi]